MVQPRNLSDLRPGEISQAVEKYMGGSSGISQYSRPQSWDFCYEHFLDMNRAISDREASCMQLGYYLASWGMLRGGSYLFKKTNARHYLNVISVAEEYENEVRQVTPDQFSSHHVQDLLVSLYNDLAAQLLPEGGRGITLVTKTIMGIWGVFPSLDRYFMNTFNGFAKSAGQRRLFSRFTTNTIEFLGEFYETHRDELDGLAGEYRTVNFQTGQASEHKYPVAKIIDIYGFNAAFNA